MGFLRRLRQACGAFWCVLFSRPTPRPTQRPTRQWTVSRMSEDGSVAQRWHYHDRELADERMRAESESGSGSLLELTFQ